MPTVHNFNLRAFVKKKQKNGQLNSQTNIYTLIVELPLFWFCKGIVFKIIRAGLHFA